MNAILVDGLTKTFAPKWPWNAAATVLSGLSLSVGRGEIYGFLGPNGAGKTTTLKILLGLMRATAGKAELLGHSVNDVKVHQRIGFLPESPYFYDYLTGEEFLSFYGRLAGLRGAEVSSRVTALLELVGLAEVRKRQLRKFSKGMLQRIGLAQAIIHDPELVILDEPMSGLDPIGRKQIRDLILNFREDGKTVFFSTHIIPDVEMICDRVGIVVGGKLLASGRIDELVRDGHTKSVEVVCEGIQAELVPTITAIATRVLQQGRRSMIVLPSPDQLENILKTIRANKGTLISVTPQKGSLEEIFFQSSHSQK